MSNAPPRGQGSRVLLAAVQRMIEEALRNPPPNTLLGHIVAVAAQNTTSGSGGGGVFGPTTHTHDDITDWMEALADSMNEILVAGDGIKITYDDALGKIKIEATGLVFDNDGILVTDNSGNVLTVG